MTILGVDPGYANCGWSVVDCDGRVLALGVILTTQTGADLATDRERRVAIVGAELRDIAMRFGCVEIAAEEALGHGASSAVAANMLPWGGLIMLALERGALLRKVRAKTWQHAVLGDDFDTIHGQRIPAAGFCIESEKHGKATHGVRCKACYAEFRYRHIEERISAHVDAPSALADIAAGNRNHALDACGIGLLGALRPHLTTVIVERRAA